MVKLLKGFVMEMPPADFRIFIEWEHWNFSFFFSCLFDKNSDQNLFFQFLNYFIIVQLQLSAFSPHLSTPPQPNPPPSPASALPLGFVHVSFIVVPVIPSSEDIDTKYWLK